MRISRRFVITRSRLWWKSDFMRVTRPGLRGGRDHVQRIRRQLETRLGAALQERAAQRVVDHVIAAGKTQNDDVGLQPAQALLVEKQLLVVAPAGYARVDHLDTVAQLAAQDL